MKRKYKLENRYTRLEVDYDFHKDFHIYGLLWTPDELVWYLDGKEVFRRKNDFFKRPLHIIFDAEIINFFGEFERFDKNIKSKEIKLINFYNKKLFNYLPRHGKINSRISFILIFLMSFK